MTDIVIRLRQTMDVERFAIEGVMKLLGEAAIEIERLRSLAGAVSAGPTASELYHGLRRVASEPIVPMPGQSAEADGH